MKLHAEHGATGGHRITAYGAGFVAVNDSVFTGTVMLGENVLATDFGELGPDDLNTATVSRLRELNPEIVIVGTGRTHVFPPSELFVPLIRGGIGVEIMSTSAACRTYNILLAEGRNVLALLLPNR